MELILVEKLGVFSDQILADDVVVDLVSYNVHHVVRVAVRGVGSEAILTAF